MTADLSLAEFARQKLVRVFGEHRAGQILEKGLSQANLPAITTPDELLRFGRVLEGWGGFESAIGALLCVQATLHGARG